MYADNTTSGCQGKNLAEIIQNLKHDADAILSYMASNGLVANASKTVFLILNITKKEAEEELANGIEVDGKRVTRSTETKLLGVTIDDKQNWKDIYVKGPHPTTSLWASLGENLTGLGGGMVFLID